MDPVQGSEAQWPGEAKISGRAIDTGPTSEGPEGDLFHGDITEVVHTHLNETATRDADFAMYEATRARRGPGA